MEQTTDNKDFEKFMKWFKILTIAAMVFWGLWIGRLILTVLREFTDLEEKAPFLYGKIFAGILLAIVLVLITLMIISYIKARKYKKLIENSNDDENQDIKKQNDSDS